MTHNAEIDAPIHCGVCRVSSEGSTYLDFIHRHADCKRRPVNEDDGPVPYLDGHCQTHGRPDQFHGLCPGGFRSGFGVEHYCSCPNHDNDKESA